MKALIAGLLLLVACKDDVEMFPVSPGGGGGNGGSHSGPDAGSDVNPDGGDGISGRVCLLDDPTQPTLCADSGAGGLTVKLDTSTATTADNGNFAITRPTGSNLVWTVTGDAIAPSAMSFGTVTTIPAIEIGVYAGMVTTSNATQPIGDGAIIAQIRRGTTPVAGLTATSTPVPEGLTYFYDGNSAENWAQNVTGPRGMIWVPGIVPPESGGAQLVVTDDETDRTIDGIPVFADTVTFVFAVIP